MTLFLRFILLSAVALSYFSQISAFPSGSGVDEKLYEQADKYFKALDKDLDSTHVLPSETDKDKIVEGVQTLVEKAGGHAYDKFKEAVDELYGDKEHDTSPYQFFGKTRELIKEKLAPIHAELSQPGTKEKIFKKAKKDLKKGADSLYEAIKEGEIETNQEEKKEIHVYREIANELKNKNVELKDKLNKLDDLYVTLLRGITDDVENTIKDTKNQFSP